MLKALKRILWSFLSLAIFLTIINIVKPPKSWVDSSIFQILAFFIPLFAFLTLFCHIFVRQLAISFIIAACLVLALILQAIRELNYVTSIGVIVFAIAAILIYRRFNNHTNLN